MDNKAINIEEIMDEIRREIKEKGLSADMLSFEDVPCPKPEDAIKGNALDSEEIRNALIYMNGHYNVQPYKPLGGNALVVFIKKVIRKLTKFYVEPVVFEQNTYNANTIRVLNALCQAAPQPAAAAPAELLQRLETLELNQMHLTKRLEALQQENDALRAALEGREQA